MSNQFTSIYASAYDLLNSQKPYKDEVVFLQDLYRQTTRKTQLPLNVLDLGCGSGQHLKHFDINVNRVGVDLSEHMLKIASDKQIPNSSFCVADISEYRSEVKFDLIYSLFHVLSYQILNSQVLKLFQSVQSNLSDQGVAVFDYWHRAAWDKDPPVTRITIKEDSRLRVLRTSEPQIDTTNGTVDISMNIFIQDKFLPSNSYQHFSERHTMRSFSLSELQLFAQLAGLIVQASGPWMASDRKLESQDWYGWIVLSKNRQTSF
jgi:SAM-dependent methyltransferase